MAEFYSNKLLGSPSINSSAFLLPFNLSPHLINFPVFRFTPSSRRRPSSQQFLASASSHLAPSSSSITPKIDILSTTERSDGSLVFEFGDPSEIVQSKGNVGSCDSELREEDDLEGEEVSLFRNMVKEETTSSSKPKQGDELGATSDSIEDESGRENSRMREEAPSLDGKLNEIRRGSNAATFSSDGDSTIHNPIDVENNEILTSVVENSNNLHEDAHDGEVQALTMTWESDNVEGHENACYRRSHDRRIDGNVAFSYVAVQDDHQLLETVQTDDVERDEKLSKTLCLSLGVASLPHPSEALTGAADAYFIAGKDWFGVANGVGQWSLKGMKNGLYAQELLENCEKLVLNNSSNDIVSNVRDTLKQSAATVKSPGLASVLIAHFDNQVLHVANIGDTGYIIVRNGLIHRRSYPMSREFNLPLQIGMSDDPVEVIDEYQVELEDGDVIITATDGFFDNLYEQDMASIISESLGANMTAKELAEVLAQRAQDVGRCTSGRSPFADAAQAAGYAGYTGGKLDHVTVIISLAEKQQSSTWY